MLTLFKIKVSPGLYSFLEALEENLFSCFSSDYRPSTFIGSWPLPPSSKPAKLCLPDCSSTDHISL